MPIFFGNFWLKHSYYGMIFNMRNYCCFLVALKPTWRMTTTIEVLKVILKLTQ
ncbi:hypothetical protein MTBBW1_140009 [Desulfamplus magnetovallimortis]|uniref:Uncharacterized protein n=1 Tax=Desulfamplus magnetovallimortis TaxID=1246637 RepID=A0A1W1H7Y7_9BACT|nr:hypothetical protein MTBBW1_140009 [Desulfamplus magnetovallimortis]